MRILIVEDEQHIADGLRFNVEAEGYEAEIVGDGEAALIAAGERGFDAIILDVMLPGINGFDVAAALRARQDYTPILMLTARGRPEDVLKGFEAGTDDYLPKPFDLEIFLARLNGLLRRRGVAVEQGEHRAQQVEDLGMGLARVEQPRDGVARAPRGIQGIRALAQRPVRGQRLRARHGEQVRAPLVQAEGHAEERLQAPPEPAARAAHALGDRADPAPPGRVQVQDAVGLAEAHRPQHDGLGGQRSGHAGAPAAPRKGVAIFNEVMAEIIIYSTDPCSFCTRAKELLEQRGVAFEEVNLAKDPVGRAKLASETGMLSFPQIVIDGAVLGGFRELITADQSGRLEELAA